VNSGKISIARIAELANITTLTPRPEKEIAGIRIVTKRKSIGWMKRLKRDARGVIKVYTIRINA
tara:strand:+ start:759 stop:950 length:192 start_codon:yes stop_codon:yes gene_type:complete